MGRVTTEPKKLDVQAQYLAVSDFWTDIPEAEPRTRVKTEEGNPDVLVTVTNSGDLYYEDDRLKVDTTYEDGMR